MEHVENKASKNIIEDKIEKLKDLFPEAFTESSDECEPRWKVDFETLKQLLGDYSEDRQERYSFSWNGKSRASLIAQTPSTGTLRPCPGESVDWDTTKNLFIEGDNLEVLKLLQKSYHKKVKMIYIDPPYNTGNEFIYPDKFQDNLDTYLRYTGQVDDEGFKASTNSETGGRYHTNWLNMMYPRLKLARNLLRDDGVIFISIDDNEVANLRKVCDEIFGEENFVAEFVWKRRASSAMADNNVSADHEYVIAYQKGGLEGFKGIEKDFKNYQNPDNDPRGPWVLGDLTVGMTASMRPNQAYDLIDPNTSISYSHNPNRVWAYIPSSMQKLIVEERVVFPDDPSKRPMQKRFQNELKSTHNPLSSLIIEKVGLNTEATRLIQQLMGGNVFDYSKPLSLLSTLIPQVCNQDDIVLDFFAGSSVTAHATLQLNAISGYNRKFIMVQLPEPTSEKSEAFKAGYTNIAEIGKERIRRAGKKIQEEKPDYDGDLGFKVFKLGSSNIKPWDADFDNYKEALMNSVENIKSERTEQDVLYELLLKYGLDLTIPIETRSIQGKNVYIIGAGALVVCLDDEITLDAVEGIAKLREELKPEVMRVVFKDAGFKDATVKTNTVQILRIADIEDVKSL